jgi:prevent-host-death family protein
MSRIAEPLLSLELVELRSLDGRLQGEARKSRPRRFELLHGLIESLQQSGVDGHLHGLGRHGSFSPRYQYSYKHSDNKGNDKMACSLAPMLFVVTHGQTWSTMAMKTNTSQFKAKLGVFMRKVREGGEVIITDRDRPVARLVPFEASAPVGLQMIRPEPGTTPFGKIKIKGIPYCGTDSTAMLREERDRR